MESMGHMVVLSAAGIISALIGDMVITPVIIIFLKPFKK